jgi:hypothetical protein
MTQNPYWSRRGRPVTIWFIVMVVFIAGLGFIGWIPRVMVIVIAVLMTFLRLGILKFRGR